MKPIRVLVVDDSAFMRKVIRDMLGTSNNIDVISTARNGTDGLKKTLSLRPDVITLDVEMPIMNGLEMLEHVMKECPTPTLMLSHSTLQGAENTVKALSIGAVDFLAKPANPLSISGHEIKEELIGKVYNAAQANLSQKRSRLFSSTQNITRGNTPYKNYRNIIAIGASTGGPKTLQTVLTSLQEDFPAPVVIAQHLPPRFTKSLANRLDRLSAIRVKEAEHDEILRDGTAYIAPGGHHLKIDGTGQQWRAMISPVKDHLHYSPSVNILFESIAQLPKSYAVAVVLTGMGQDGADGLQLIKGNNNPSVVIAQSEETSVVFGMPKAALSTNCVDEVQHIQDIGNRIIQLLNQ
ncbi:protein-glutamate methylesterase/protein-glutamine glutaminase [Salirhabdus salicampi]|uniref:protein-glutamate methylesterase/protein-glutamine glutaminase n=1 Tax=Salirhabdus salicampi TaxID=476102 RepID=UPI0020C4DFCD|nr:chemotaxis response regulator protein-glutamate methylesterase [Salirhabdus salicampi]MCP8616502.1 chemotaxis response regulator protein-glutamate methylesterase [Salirhabdus salicampi]